MEKEFMNWNINQKKKEENIKVSHINDSEKI